MSNLADMFAFAYEADLDTLNLVVQEIIRIRNERRLPHAGSPDRGNDQRSRSVSPSPEQ